MDAPSKHFRPSLPRESIQAVATVLVRLVTLQAHGGRLAFGVLVLINWQSFGKTESPRQDFAVRCGVRFLTPNKAELRWESSIPGTASVAYGRTRKLGTIVDSLESGTSHQVDLAGLEPGNSYFYRIAVRNDGKRYFSPFYEFDSRMNYSPPVIGQPNKQPVGLQAVLDKLAQRGGYAVVIGDAVEVWGESLAARTAMTVIAVADDEPRVQKWRRRWYAKGVYGIRLSAHIDEDVPDRFANLVVCSADSFNDAKSKLSPMGMAVCLQKRPDGDDFNWTLLDEGVWVGHAKTVPKLVGWGHQYGSSANGSYVGETLGGVDQTSDLEIRWLGRPGADFGIDRGPRMPAPLAIGGRLFHQGMNRMIALDAFNGAVLWSLEIPDLRRVNIPRDSSNWCADGQHVYAATRDGLWVIDAATGEMKHLMRLPESIGGRANESRPDQKFDWGFVAVSEDVIIGTAVKAGSAYEDYWSKPAWYDGMGDSATAKVCGSAIVVYDKKYGDVRWQRNVDAVLQSTMTITDDKMFFVEVFDPSLNEFDSGKLPNKRIWKNAAVVCLDLKTGKEVWKKSVATQDEDQIVAFGAADADQFLLETSRNNQFHFRSFDGRTGDQNWRQSVQWPSDNHGAHMQHAVLMNGRIYIQPHVLDAKDGRVVKSNTLGKRRGCATPIGAGQSIIYRGGTGPLSLWSLEREKPSEFSRLRPSCWLSTIPAQGMLFSPEAGGGCSCGDWMECSIGFAPLPSALKDHP